MFNVLRYITFSVICVTNSSRGCGSSRQNGDRIDRYQQLFSVSSRCYVAGQQIVGVALNSRHSGWSQSVCRRKIDAPRCGWSCACWYLIRAALASITQIRPRDAGGLVCDIARRRRTTDRLPVKSIVVARCWCPFATLLCVLFSRSSTTDTNALICNWQCGIQLWLNTLNTSSAPRSSLFPFSC